MVGSKEAKVLIPFLCKIFSVSSLSLGVEAKGSHSFDFFSSKNVRVVPTVMRSLSVVSVQTSFSKIGIAGVEIKLTKKIRNDKISK